MTKTTTGSGFFHPHASAPTLLGRLPDAALDRIAELSDARTRRALATAVPEAAEHCSFHRDQDAGLPKALREARSGDAIAAALTQYHVAAKKLVYLDLHGRNLGADGTLTVSRALRERCPNIERLSLADNAIRHIAPNEWALPETLRVLNLSGHPELFAADAPVWKAPANLQGLNLQGVSLPAAWATKRPRAAWPLGLEVLHPGDIANLDVFRLPETLWHITTDSEDPKLLGERVAASIPNLREVVRVTGGERSHWHAPILAPQHGDLAMRQYTCGPRPMLGRSLVTDSALLQAVVQTAFIYMSHNALMRQAYERHPRMHMGVEFATQIFCLSAGAHSRLGLLGTMGQTLDTIATQAVLPGRRTGLGDVSGMMTPWRDLAVEGLYFWGNAMATGLLAPINGSARLGYMFAVNAPATVPALSVQWLALYMISEHQPMWLENDVCTVAAIGSAVCFAIASAMVRLTSHFAPNYYLTMLHAPNESRFISDWTMRQARSGLRTLASWAVGAPQ